ncbi:MAG: hypothetical protein LUG16_01645 [Candidatus Gastranaerophilales bacterium]|nr:hypothetical protein [Candidatus Gastranaerophilales bacterium]
MRNLFFVIAIMIFFALPSFSSDDYDSLYESAEPFKSRLYNDVDPFQDEDMIKYAWSPYPLFRTSAYLYFKDSTIEPGYYSLTPRTFNGSDYILFKQNGKVQFVIPSAKTEATPLNFYEANTPKIKQTKWQKFASNVKKKFYDTAQDSMRSTPPSSMLNVEADVKYIILVLYYGEKKYTAVFKRTPY